jgi:hypothetical protein
MMSAGSIHREERMVLARERGTRMGRMTQIFADLSGGERFAGPRASRPLGVGVHHGEPRTLPSFQMEREETSHHAGPPGLPG